MATAATTQTKMDRIMEMLESHPEMTASEVCGAIPCDPGTYHRAKARLAERASQPVEIAIDRIDTDQGTQLRPDMDEAREVEFSERMAAGEEFDPIELIEVAPGRYVITDGFHRLAAAIRADFETIKAIVRKGTLEDAMRAAARANAKGTLPRCSKTIRNAVLAIIELDGHEKTIAHYAAAACCHVSVVKAVLDAYLARNGLEKPEAVIGKDGKAYPTRRPKPEPDQVSARRTESNGETVYETMDASEVPTEDEEDPDAPPRRLRPRIEENGHAPTPTPTPTPTKRAMSDQEFLSTLYRDTGKTPTRDRLTPEKRELFDATALQYKRITDSPTHVEWMRLVRSTIDDRRVGGGKGPLAVVLSRVLRVEHPRDWPTCFSCSGSGVAKTGGECGDCYGHGFKLR